MAELRIGLVGAGMVARHHLTAWARCRAAKVVAIADPVTAAADRRFAPGVAVFTCLGDMLAAGGVDAIDIAAPVEAHVGLVREAVSAGLPVLCQKPLAPTAREARDLVGSLPQDARVMLHENWRWRPSYRAIADHLRTAPKPRSFDLRTESSGLCRAADGSYPALRRQPFLADLDRLTVFELLGHHLDVLFFLFGQVEIRSARIRHRCLAVKGEDFARIELSAGGIPGTLTGDFAVPEAPPRPADRLVIDDRLVLSDWRLDLPSSGRSWHHDDAYQTSYDDCIAHFAACLASGAAFETDASHGADLLGRVESIYVAASDRNSRSPAGSGQGRP